MTRAEICGRLHEAADRLGTEPPTDEWQALADAGGLFLQESTLWDEGGEQLVLSSSEALGYGVMLGWLAREALDV